jgi:hypothetical protein
MWDITFSPPELLLHNYKCGGVYVPCCVTVNTNTIVNWKNSTKCYWRLWHITNMIKNVPFIWIWVLCWKVNFISVIHIRLTNIKIFFNQLCIFLMNTVKFYHLKKMVLQYKNLTQSSWYFQLLATCIFIKNWKINFSTQNSNSNKRYIFVW